MPGFANKNIRRCGEKNYYCLKDLQFPKQKKKTDPCITHCANKPQNAASYIKTEMFIIYENQYSYLYSDASPLCIQTKTFLDVYICKIASATIK